MSAELTGGALLGVAIVRLVGVFMLGDKNINGWLIGMASAVGSIAWASYTGAYTLVAINTATILLCWRGYRKWGRIQDKRRIENHDLRNRLHIAELRVQELEGKI